MLTTRTPLRTAPAMAGLIAVLCSGCILPNRDRHTLVDQRSAENQFSDSTSGSSSETGGNLEAPETTAAFEELLAARKQAQTDLPIPILANPETKEAEPSDISSQYQPVTVVRYPRMDTMPASGGWSSEQEVQLFR